MLLIVDDDQDIRESLSEYLLTNGYQTICAENAEAARQALAAHSFQAIILDIMMPGEDGLSLCRHISSTLNIPILMLTAMNEDMDTIIGLEVGADDYNTKPYYGEMGNKPDSRKTNRWSIDLTIGNLTPRANS